jgi:ABC transporter with metal-binding/Fe-S-binding domain ATP-binding protein
MQGWDVECLVTVFPESQDSWMFHYPTLEWTGLQAKAIGVGQTVIQTRGVKEEELADLKAGLSKMIQDSGVEGIVSGAVASEYQRTRIDNICEALGVRSFAPLWHKNQEQLVREQIDSGFEIIITACSALGLDANWVGRRLGASELVELVKLHQRYGLNVAFEGGEAETFVLGAPVFRGRLNVARSEVHWKGESGYLELQDVRFEQ